MTFIIARPQFLDASLSQLRSDTQKLTIAIILLPTDKYHMERIADYYLYEKLL